MHTSTDSVLPTLMSAIIFYFAGTVIRFLVLLFVTVPDAAEMHGAFSPPVLFRSLLSFFGFVFAFGSLLAGSLQAVP